MIKFTILIKCENKCGEYICEACRETFSKRKSSKQDF